MPKPLLEPPEETTYHKAQAELDEKIEAQNAKFVSNHSRRLIKMNNCLFNTYLIKLFELQKELGERFAEKLS